MRSSGLMLLAILVFAFAGNAEIINVPDDFETIQAGIDASEDGDTVLVAPGIYVENISFIGKGILIASLILLTDDRAYIDSTIIDGNDDDCVVCFANEEDSTSILQGFTIRNGIQDFGGGVDCGRNSKPLLLDLLITGNEARRAGGGVYFTYESEPVIRRTIISENHCGTGGGGISSWLRGHAVLDDVVITDNTSDYLGGGIFAETSNFTLRNVLVYNNTATRYGGVWLSASLNNTFVNVTITGNTSTQNCVTNGLFLTTSFEDPPRTGSSASLSNCLIWGNTGAQIVHMKYGEQEYMLEISYCDIEGGEDGVSLGGGAELDWLEGNIDEDPLFVDAENGDYRLTADSPCIDAGDPESEPDPDGTRADMGAFYFLQNQTPEVIGEIEDFVLEEDHARINIAELETIFSDPDGFDELSFELEGDERLGLEIDEANILSLEPALNFFGDSLAVTVFAFDRVDTVSVGFMVTITPLNDPPSAFSLLVPADSSEVNCDD